MYLFGSRLIVNREVENMTPRFRPIFKRNKQCNVLDVSLLTINESGMAPPNSASFSFLLTCNFGFPEIAIQALHRRPFSYLLTIHLHSSIILNISPNTRISSKMSSMCSSLVIGFNSVIFKYTCPSKRVFAKNARPLFSNSC